MRLGNVGDITKKKTGEIILTYNGKEINSSIYVNCADELKQLYSAVSRTREDDREAKVIQWLHGDLIPEITNSLGINGSEPQAAPLPDPIKGLENLINFFSEFNFEPNCRFVNTLARNLSKSEKEGREYISNYVIDGSVKGRDRVAMVDAFNKDKTNCFLITLKSGGTGLNLTSADVVIHLDIWWNPQAEN